MHEIDMTTGKAAVMVAGTAAWHRLGANVEAAQTAAQAIELAVMNWTVGKMPLTADVGGTAVALENHFATVRMDTRAVLGVVGKDYTPYQNSEAFDFMDAIVGRGEAAFETAGCLNGGRRVWILARMPQTIEVVAGDPVKPYILLYNSHDGSSALRMLPTTVRVVCANTLSLALGRAKASEGLSITHHESLPARVDEARHKLHLIAARMEEYGAQAKRLARVQMNGQQLAAYFSKLVADRSEKHQKKVLGSFLDNLEDPTNSFKGVRGTAWAAYNAVSHYADHQMTVRGQTESAKLNNRVNSIFFGPANDLKQAAWEQILATAS